LKFISSFLVLDEWDYGFAENGLTAFKLGKELPSESFIGFLGEERYKPLVNFILHYIADLDLPIKRYLFLIYYHQSGAIMFL
jgi:phosphomannomutase